MLLPGPATGWTPPPTMKCCKFAWPFHSSTAPSPIPSPSGGGCRPQGRQERENAAGPQCGNDRNRGVCKRFYRLQAVTFSLFRHPPRGGSADATFPRWGKEGALADSPDAAAHLRCCCGTGHGLDAVPYKALLSCFDGDGKRKKTTNVLKLWTPLLLFVPFVRGFAAWVFFSAHSCPLRLPPKRYPGPGIFCIARTKSRPALRKSLANPPRLR